MFGHHIKTYEQNLSTIGSLVGNLLRLQAWSVSQMICFCQIWLLHKFYYLINVFSMKHDVFMCNISKEQEICSLHGGIKMTRLHYLINHNANLVTH